MSPPFSVGQQVFVKAKFFRTTHSFTLRLPDSMRGVHPVFHVSMLEPTTPNEIPNHTQSPPPLIHIDGEPEFEITEVVDSKIDKRR